MYLLVINCFHSVITLTIIALQSTADESGYTDTCP